MTTFERRQTILRILQEQAGVKVTDLATMLNVSEGTIRNDLAALDEEQQLTRVRGGAVARLQAAYAQQLITARARVNSDAKQRIAQWAAGMVENGDAIVLDASSTVLYMATYLQTRRDLTVVTNGLEVARRLSESASNTVILVGGVLRSDGNALTGLLGAKMLEDLHIRTAFVSGVGFSVEAGLMEMDIPQAEIKSLMIKTAQQVVALVDYSKFAQMGLIPFAKVHDLDYLVTDNKVTPAIMAALHKAKVTLTISSEHMTATYTPDQMAEKRHKIGFANISEEMPFGRDVRRGLERAAKASQVELLVTDNQLSGEIALQVVDDLILEQVDLAIEYQIDESVGSLIAHKFNQAGIPVIAVDIPMVGATFFGVDNYQTGYVAGVELGHAVQQEWGGQFDRLIILEHPRAGMLTATRLLGQLDGLREVLGELDPQQMISLDCGNTSQISEAEMLQLLPKLANEHHLAVICFNDDAAIGALEAARQLYRMSDVLIVGQGADRRLRDELRRGHSRIIGSTAFHPERYGEKLIAIALKILKGETVPPAVYMEHTFIKASNIDQYYPILDNDR
jgi:ribose transport system substrate-binding protein